MCPGHIYCHACPALLLWFSLSFLFLPFELYLTLMEGLRKGGVVKYNLFVFAAIVILGLIYK